MPLQQFIVLLDIQSLINGDRIRLLSD